MLRKIATAIRDHATTSSSGSSASTSGCRSRRRGVAARAAENFGFFADAIVTLGTTPSGSARALNYVVRRPVGVAGLITPWNTPFMLETWKLAPCLAVGLHVVLKPAEWSPLTANRLAEVMQEADVPPGRLQRRPRDRRGGGRRPRRRTRTSGSSRSRARRRPGQTIMRNGGAPT